MEDIEQLHQYALMEDRLARREDREVDELSRQVSPPNMTRYYIGFTLSVIGDLIDIVAFVLIIAFGAGIPLGWLVDILIDVPLLFLGFRSSKKLKEIGKSSNVITEKITIIDQKIAQYRNRYALILRTSRKIKALRRPVRQFARKARKVTKVLRRNPLGRLVAGILADLVPGLDLIPFRTIAMYQSYKDERESYETFRLLVGEDYTQAREEEVGTLNDMLALEAELDSEDSEEERELAA